MEKRKPLLKRAGQTLSGHIVFAQFYMSIPVFALLLWFEISDGRLTVLQAVYDAVLASVGGAAWGVLMWYTVSLPLIRKNKTDETVRRPK